MIPVVIGTNPKRNGWLRDCLTSIRATSKHRRVHVHAEGGYELTALRSGMTRFRTFLFLHDSCEILHPDFWASVDQSGPTWLFGGPPMFLGVYNTSDLETALHDAPYGMDVTKRAAIAWEGELPKRLTYPTLWPEVHDGTGYHADRHGRDNLVLENALLRKWKGNWGQSPTT